MILDPDSIPVDANVPVIFKKCLYRKGNNKEGKPWALLNFYFVEKARTERLFSHTSWQPRPVGVSKIDHYISCCKYFRYLSEILNNLSGKDVTSSIPLHKRSWTDFYEDYIPHIDKVRNTECFIKTVACPSRADRSVATACLAEKNFISLNPDLSYSILEDNMVEEVRENSGIIVPQLKY